MTAVTHQGILIIIDGLGDLPIATLGGRTPLEAAFTPNMDQLAATGLFGQVDPLGPGIVPNTDSGTGMLMGLMPGQAGLLKRGPIEAAGAGRPLQKTDVALRANFATADASNGQLNVTDRRAGRIVTGLDVLAAELSEIDLEDGVSAELITTEQHRAVLVLSGEGLHAQVSDTDPGEDILPSPVRQSVPLQPAASRCADKLNRFVQIAHKHLSSHAVNKEREAAGEPVANAVITRGAGAVIVPENRLCTSGVEASLVAGCNTVGGLGQMFGFEWKRDPSFTADSQTDLDAKFRCALQELSRQDRAQGNVVFVHIKAPDIFAHDQQPVHKRDFIERIDAALRPVLDANVVLGIAADHTTDSNTGMHTADPVPALLYNPAVDRATELAKFGESACREGNMKRQTSAEFLDRFLQIVLNGSVAE